MEYESSNLDQDKLTISTDYEALLTQAQSEVPIEALPVATKYEPAQRAHEMLQASREKGSGAEAVAFRERFLEPDFERGEFGVTTAEEAKVVQSDLLTAMHEQAELRKPFSKVAVRMSIETLSRIVVDGEGYKTLAESGATNAHPEDFPPERLELYKGIRDEQERLSGMRKTEDEPPPIFAYLEETDTVAERSIASKYGDAEIILKDDVIDRTTFTVGDSLDTGYNPIDFENAVYVQQLKDIGAQRNARSTWNDGGYVEAQVFGGVNKEDISGIVLTSNAVLLQGKEGEIERDDVTKTFKQVDALRQSAPDADVTIRFDIRYPFNRKAVLEYANDNADVKIVLFMSADSAFLAGANERKTGKGIVVDQVAGAERSRDAAQTRLAQAKLNLESYQRSQMGREGLPSNLVLTVAIKNYQAR